jgi:hypothetical protein
MPLFQHLRSAIDLLKPWQGYYAICGGIAACLYRETPRFTGDIDIALIDPPQHRARDIAQEILLKLGFDPKLGFVADQHGRLIEEVALVAGREEKPGAYAGIDLIMPVLPWISAAVERAQHNLLNYGFAEVATVIPEDLIIAKLFAYQGTPDRKHDLDDMLSILKFRKDLDLRLITELITLYQLRVPREIAEFL